MRNLLAKRQPVFTIGQFDRLSNIFDIAGQVIFGIAVLAPLIGGFDKNNLMMLILGLIGLFGCWSASIWFAKKG